jgi:hypothetical protein
MIKLFRPPFMNQTHGNDSDHHPGNGSHGGNHTNDGPSRDHFNESMPLGIILNTHMLDINKCNNQSMSVLEIVASKGYEMGYRSIIWRI